MKIQIKSEFSCIMKCDILFSKYTEFKKGRNSSYGGINFVKVFHIGKVGNVEKYSSEGSFLAGLELVDAPHGLSDDEYIRLGKDADFLIADAISPVSAYLIGGMPHLKLIHSEGVAFNAIDTAAAAGRGIYVCNSSGMNATAVAEQALLLMLGMVKNVVVNDKAVREGRQIEVKGGYMQRGDLMELADFSVGLVGFGDIAVETARLLRAFGVENIFYNKRKPLAASEENALGVQYMELDELLGSSDIVSLHLPLNEQTKGMVNEEFFSGMREGSFFVNTARGELVDDKALIRALERGKLKMAGLDTVSNEPVKAEHELLNLPEEISGKILFSPHIGGITAASFRRSYAMISEDIEDVANGRRPRRVVNNM